MWTSFSDSDPTLEEEEACDHLIEILEATGVPYGETVSDGSGLTQYFGVRITDDVSVVVVQRPAHYDDPNEILVLTKEVDG